MARAVIALGSNIGDRRSTLRSAVAALEGLGSVVAVSGLYETAPVGGPEQDEFLNAVVVVETDLGSAELLARLHAIEADHDRQRKVRWGPRTLDLDLVLHGDVVVDSADLSVPHPRYRERRFVLEPLLDAWPDARDPDGTELSGLLASVADQELRKVEDRSWTTAQSSRGAGWVVGQLSLLAVFVLLLALTEPTFDHLLLDGGGAVAIGFGVLVVILASRDLGDQTTPFPEPVSGGALVDAGIYGRMRHPMYAGVMLVGLGAAMLNGSIYGLATIPVAAVFFSLKARHEERRLVAAHPGYEDYRQRVPHRFWP